MRYPHLSFLLLLVSTLNVLGAAVTPSPPPPTTSDYIIRSIWAEGGPLGGNKDVSFHLTLKSPNLAGLAAKIEQISLDNQGKWLNEDDLRPFVSPTPEVTKTVMDFLHSSSVPDSAIVASKFGDRLNVTLPNDQVLKLFSNAFWSTNVDHEQFSKTRSSLEGKFGPPALVSTSHGSIQTAPTGVQMTKRSGATPAGCDNLKVTPKCLKDFYGLSGYKIFQTNDAKADVTTVSDTGHFVDQKDIDAYIAKYAPDQAGYKLTVETALGGYNDESKADSEGVYITQALIGMMAPLKVNFMIIRKEWFADFHEQIFNLFVDQYNDKTRPKIISIPYSSFELYNKDAQMRTMCDAAMKLSALGTTLVVSSGNYGVGSNVETCPPTKPSYPSGCPYILSVGFTQSFDPEVLYDGDFPYASGAGTSNAFGIPSYQAKVLADYQKIIGPMNGVYNVTGRSFPDIVAHGTNNTHILQGKDILMSGEGNGVQTAASILSYVNNKRAAAGKGQLGYIQPALYKYGTLYDIQVGGSYACSKTKPDIGFPAKPGFDTASGLGSPHFDVISKAMGV